MAENKSSSDVTHDATRVCTNCGHCRPIERFAVAKERPGGRRATCRECKAAYDREYRKANRERLALVGKAWREANKPKWLAQQATWRKANPDRVRAYMQKRAHKVRVYFVRWYAENADKAKANARNYQTRQRGAIGRFTVGNVRAIRAAQRGRCGVCRRQLRGRGQIDHITPLARGGSNEPRNLQLLCRPCNSNKRAKDPISFMQELGFLL
ncbi:HNH endonuclease [Roseomonas chloroacetimidivorans]|uniref:HNH endonuclease n=1 Tax=Roseomonas chloroacetimidivorans TaxID=1766656 RepID=UPI003C7912AC